MKNKHISIFLILLTGTVLIYSWYNISRSEFEVDKLDQLLAPVLKRMAHSSTIDFDTNTTEVGRIELLNLYMNFVMAPRINVHAGGHDTLLSVSDFSLPSKNYDKYRIIESGEHGGFGYSLMVIKK